jgi:hypothetical protein
MVLEVVQNFPVHPVNCADNNIPVSKTIFLLGVIAV